MFKKTLRLGDIVIGCPRAQIEAWIRENKNQWEFWQVVKQQRTWAFQNKTEADVDALINYFEGRFDMACNFRTLINEKVKA